MRRDGEIGAYKLSGRENIISSPKEKILWKQPPLLCTATTTIYTTMHNLPWSLRLRIRRRWQCRHAGSYWLPYSHYRWSLHRWAAKIPPSPSLVGHRRNSEQIRPLHARESSKITSFVEGSGPLDDEAYIWVWTNNTIIVSLIIWFSIIGCMLTSGKLLAWRCMLELLYRPCKSSHDISTKLSYNTHLHHPRHFSNIVHFPSNPYL